MRNSYPVRRRLVARAVAALAVVSLAGAARAALIIVPTYDDASFTGAAFDPTAVHTAFAFAANEIASLYSDNIHVNVTVQAGNVGLGQSNTPVLTGYSYADLQTALIADNTAHPSAAGNTSVASLPVTDPTGSNSYVVTRAQAKALGIIADDGTRDGTFTFSNAQSYTFDPANRAVSGRYDFIGVAEHEISEIMGRIDALGLNIGGQAVWDANDLFRFTANGVRSLNQTDTGVYLSANDGATNLATFNSAAGADLGDYNGADPTDSFNAFADPGVAHNLSSAGITNLDIIGYDRITATGAATGPEPASVALVCVGALGFLARRRFAKK